ncbi:hypothetical protein SDC9_195850 [bioreactor metagenome]|uniref:Uncharacterized protein n=1 Tax=bioreactor metagenome TaxID=1076179 RepID=A0A645IA71_9ZZZZ
MLSDDEARFAGRLSDLSQFALHAARDHGQGDSDRGVPEYLSAAVQTASVQSRADAEGDPGQMHRAFPHRALSAHDAADRGDGGAQDQLRSALDRRIAGAGGVADGDQYGDHQCRH